MRVLLISTAFFLSGCLSNSSDTDTQPIEGNEREGEAISSNYVTSRDLITPDYSGGAPVKGESRIDPITGVRITRLTDVSELEGTDDALIVYSRYSPENTSGEYFLTFGSNSTTSWVVERESGDVISKLETIQEKDLGEAHEVRWDSSGNFANRIYYRYGMEFWMIEDVSSDEIQHTLIRDFSEDFPNSVKIYNDVEGDSSNDSDHWAFMAVHYGENFLGMETFLVDAFVHYQVSTDTLHSLKPSDLAGTNLDLEKDSAFFKFRPNMVEVSPLGTGIVIHYGRKPGNSEWYGDWAGSWFDGAHLWPLDFNHEAQAPVKISVGETHSGWSFDEAGREMFISQNDRTDQLDAIYIEGENSGYDNRLEIISHGDMGWSNNFHYGKMPASKKGWAFINTYSHTGNASHNGDWGADQFLMVQIKDKAQQPMVWRIAPNYNLYDGEYRDEAPAAINYLGNRIYVTTNWGGELINREVFVFELPQDWDSHF